PIEFLTAQNASAQPTVEQTGTKPAGATGSSQASVNAQTNTTSQATAPTANSAPSSVHVYTQDELLAMADNKYASGNVPLGDYKYVTDAPKVGYVYLCNVHKDNPGSMVNGPWISGDTWNFLKKVIVDGTVSWPNAVFSSAISGAYRVLSGNDLPVGYTTGTFPVASSDDAHQYDANPNSISAQTLRQNLPANPVYSATPYCMGGEVGVMSDGVALFNAFDAGLRDAPAHELQDSCSGHPQGSDEYHYHSMPACFTDINETTVLGYALDGFPITGPLVAAGKYLTTDDLDECHGLTSAINEDGKSVVTYHYVMTQDFPYSASCFRGKPVSMQVISGAAGTSNQDAASGQTGAQQGAQNGGTPPMAAISACANAQAGASCSFTDQGHSVSGTCKSPPDQSLACVPQ
ncbi:MAG TPA: YHYH protein, partial [Candidatus Paceibacterota bacterium]|nr:YHYH protein [Candidatus Paceibacterota bacterium]